MGAPPGPPPQLYLVTDVSAGGGRSVVDVVARALEGARPFRRPDGTLPLAVQLRDKALPAGALLALGRALRAVTGAAGAALFVNDRVDVALACGADGVHLPAAGLPLAALQALAPGLAAARSTHAPEEIVAFAAEAAAIGVRPAFVVFGPVFDTPSKRGLLAPRGLAGLGAAAAATSVPVIALGGVDAHVAGACRAAGAAGIACIRAVMAAADPEKEVRHLLNILNGD